MKMRFPWTLSTALLPLTPAPAVRAERTELRALDADLLAHDSATLVLDRWCERLHLADPAKVVADRIGDDDKPVPAAVRASLKADAGVTIGYRHVQLRCGASVLSEADNWYVPARLTAEMNHALETSDAPFGRVVRPLNVHRRTLSHRLLRLPHPILADSPVLEHRTVLELADGTPISFVIETYRGRLVGER